MPSPESPGGARAYGLSSEEQSRLLRTARASIEHGLHTGLPLPVAPERFSQELRAPRASFVTLRKGPALRGCTGTLEPLRPLILDVAHNAFAAAFRDPRFPPLEASELPGLHLHLSLLTQPEPLPAGSERELLERLRPGVDGLVLALGSRRATFLPAVWESLPDPGLFLAELKRKAGLPGDYWSPELRFWRYRADSIEEESDG